MCHVVKFAARKYVPALATLNVYCHDDDIGAKQGGPTADLQPPLSTCSPSSPVLLFITVSDAERFFDVYLKRRE